MPGNREKEEFREKEAQRPQEGRLENPGGGEHGDEDQERPTSGPGQPQRERSRNQRKKVETT